MEDSGRAVGSPLGDPRRLAALADAELLDGAHGETFDRLARLAARLLDVPMALVTAVGDDRKRLVGRVGVPEPWATTRLIPLSHSLCKHVVIDDGPLIVEDARVHPLVCDSPAVADRSVIAYAGVPLRSADGQVLGSLCAIDTRPRAWAAADLETLGDLAAAAMAEIDLRLASRRGLQREAHWRALVERGSDLVGLLGPGGVVRYASPSHLPLLGYPPAALEGGCLDAALHPGDRPWLEAVVAAEPDPEASWQAEVRLRHADGSWRAVEIRATDARTDPAVGGLILNGRDVTDRASAQRLGEEARRAAEELARARSEFVATVSHELRTPLTAIVGFGELLEARWEAVDDPHRRATVGKIVASARRQQRLVEDLLLLSRVEGGGLEVARAVVPLGALVEQAAAEVRAAHPGLALRLEGPADMRVAADPGRAVQVIVNLLDNAAKFGVPAVPVAASWGREGGRAALRVRDGGPGLPAGGRERLFTRFGQVSAARSRRGRVGLGLGLYLSRRLAVAMGGDLELEASGPGGSTFLFTLPEVGET